MSDSKKALRKEMGKRRALAHAEVDPALALATLIERLGSSKGPISFYWPIRTEIDPRPALRQMAMTHRVCLPVTHGNGPLTFRNWGEDTPMEADGFGVSTPKATAVEITPQTLVVPMLAFDVLCHRLGYGAGHYDRTLAGLRETGPVQTIGLAYAAQKVSTPLPIESTDQALDMIITEEGIQKPVSAT